MSIRFSSETELTGEIQTWMQLSTEREMMYRCRESCIDTDMQIDTNTQTKTHTDTATDWFPQWLSSKEPPTNAGDTGGLGLIPGSGRSP